MSSAGALTVDLGLGLGLGFNDFESVVLWFEGPLMFLECFWKAGRAFATDVGGRSKL